MKPNKVVSIKDLNKYLFPSNDQKKNSNHNNQNNNNGLDIKICVQCDKANLWGCIHCAKCFCTKFRYNDN